MPACHTVTGPIYTLITKNQICKVLVHSVICMYVHVDLEALTKDICGHWLGQLEEYSVNQTCKGLVKTSVLVKLCQELLHLISPPKVVKWCIIYFHIEPDKAKTIKSDTEQHSQFLQCFISLLVGYTHMCMPIGFLPLLLIISMCTHACYNLQKG